MVVVMVLETGFGVGVSGGDVDVILVPIYKLCWG